MHRVILFKYLNLHIRFANKNRTQMNSCLICIPFHIKFINLIWLIHSSFYIFKLFFSTFQTIKASNFLIFFVTFVLVLDYTSIYLTVSFTIERYIACCHPLIGQVLCTESRAKRVIAGSKIHFVYFNILLGEMRACMKATMY